MGNGLPSLAYVSNVAHLWSLFDTALELASNFRVRVASEAVKTVPGAPLLTTQIDSSVNHLLIKTWCREKGD